ncbi:MAG TPA: TIM barrel protein [Blastocatellia bacterium]|nr:TIM barrel protein [Blastocatellia bacterium]
MVSRRDFLAAPLAIATAAAFLRSAPQHRSVKLGCQTNAWRIDPNNFDSLLEVLRQIKELGFDGFETGYRNVQGQFANAAAARARIEKKGLKFLGCHIFLDQYDPQTRIAPLELTQKVAAAAASLGAERLILSGGGLTQTGQVGQWDLKNKVDGLNAAGRYCKSKGLRLAYHNHGPEFLVGGQEIESLARLTDPELVDFLLDCGWAFRAQADVPVFFTNHHLRVCGLHLRDFKNGEQVPLGQGEFPIRELAAVIKKVNWSGWAIIEEERLSGEKPGEMAVAPARQTLKQVFGR